MPDQPGEQPQNQQDRKNAPDHIRLLSPQIKGLCSLMVSID
jgi:hypothetical protein